MDSARDRHDGDWQLYVEGDQLYAAMLDSIRQARHSVRMESYIFRDDEVGAEILDALIAAAASGRDVYLRLDALGSMSALSAARLSALAAAGVWVLWSRVWSWRSPLHFHRRNHRKLLIIDQSIAYLGGFNVHRENSRRFYGKERWRDTHVRLQGALIPTLIELFDRYQSTDWPDHPHRRAGAYVLPNRTKQCRHHLRCVLGEGINAARERVWVTTPYFIPDLRTRRWLRLAARRGVDVRLLLPARGDVILARWASRALYLRMLRAGVRIFEYQGRVMHAKTMLVDHDWATVGTSNLDYRSLYLNDELNLVSDSERFNARLAEQFMFDTAESVEVTHQRWLRRSWLAWIPERIGWWLRRWL